MHSSAWLNLKKLMSSLFAYLSFEITRSHTFANRVRETEKKSLHTPFQTFATSSCGLVVLLSYASERFVKYRERNKKGRKRWNEKLGSGNSLVCGWVTTTITG